MRYLVVVIALASASALGIPVFAQPGSDFVFARVPEKARTKRNPLENDFEAVAAGRKLFEQHCAECHGAMAEGRKRGPSLRATAVQQAMPGEIFWLITNGVVRRGMPAWAKLPDPQRWQIVSFLKEDRP